MLRLPRVIVLFEHAQPVLQGIIKYNRLFGPWEFYRELPYYRTQLTKKKTLVRMKNFNPDGLIAHVHSKKEALELIDFIGAEVPTVIALHSGESMPGHVSMVGNGAKLGQITAEYFLNKGFKNFAYCGTEDALYWSIDRKEGFAKALKKAGSQTNVSIYKQPRSKVDCFWENEQGYMAKWLESLNKPVAILACNDDRGREILDTCLQLKLNVPEEVAVLGIGNHHITCELYEPQLSSVETNREKAGYEAAKLLDAMMKGKRVRKRKIIIEPMYVVTRRSTDIIAIEDRDVANAISYIRNNFKNRIQVNDVANAVLLSRRNLERRFRKTLNRTIYKEIKRVQIDHLCLMLTTTTMSISEIARTLGYPDLDRLSKFFRKNMGIAPSAYRRKILGDLKNS